MAVKRRFANAAIFILLLILALLVLAPILVVLMNSFKAVSYTHLDVYKRQMYIRSTTL